MSVGLLTPARVLRPLDAAEIGERFKQFRKAKGLTQAAVAAAVHVSQPTVHSWEKGSEIPGSMIEPLCALLEIDSDELLFETEVPRLPPKKRRKPADD